MTNPFRLRLAEQLLHQADEFYFALSCDRNRFLQFSFIGRDGFRRIYSAISLDLLIHDLATEIWHHPPETDTRIALKDILQGRLAVYQRQHPVSRTYAQLGEEPKKERVSDGD